MRSRALLGLLFLAGLSPAAAQTQTQTARGVVEPRVEATLSSQIAARIARMPVDRGQRVKAGELLVDFDCGLERARLRAAQAEQAGVTAKLANLRRLDQLGSVGKVDVQIAQADADRIAALIEERRLIIERCAIRAPFDAIVVDVMAHANDGVESGKPLLSLLDERSLRLVILAPSAWAAWLKPGMPLAFTVDETGDSIAGSVVNLGGRIDPASQTIPVYADIKRESRSLPLVAGMTGSATIQPPARP